MRFGRKFKSINLISSIFASVYILVIAALIFSVIKSGLNYLFNGDEFCHIQTSWLITQGSKPFVDFFSAYSPIFHWFLLPIFYLKQVNFETLYLGRILMASLFCIRLVLNIFLLQKIFNKRVSYFFLPLILFDPFTVFSGMQIRPDNLVLFVYTIGFIFLTLGLLRLSKRLFFISGLLLALTFLVSIKFTPSLFVILLILSIYLIKNKKVVHLLYFILGGIIPFILFFGYFSLQGSLSEMISEVFIEAAAIVNYWYTFAPMGMLFQAINDLVFGLSGRSPVWAYVWILPMLGAGGVFKIFFDIFSKFKNIGRKEILKLILIISFILQWVSLFFVNSVFIQYYLPVNFFMAVFAAVLIDEILISLEVSKTLKYAANFSIFFLFLFFSYFSIKANLNRANYNSFGQKDGMEKIWLRIKPNEQVFQSVLFRPLAYPVPVGYNIELFPISRIDKLPALPDVLENKKLKYLIVPQNVLLNLGNIKPEWRTYIESKYEKIEGDGDYYIRKQDL